MNTSEDERKKEYLMMQQAHKERQKYRLNTLVQAAHMAVTISLNLLSEAEDILDETKLVLNGDIMERQRKFLKRADKYCQEFSRYIKTDEEKQYYWENLEELEKKFRKWAGLNNPDVIEWRKVEDGLPDVGEKVLVVTRSGKYTLSETELWKGKKGWKGSGSFVGSIVAWRKIEKYREDKK